VRKKLVRLFSIMILDHLCSRIQHLSARVVDWVVHVQIVWNCRMETQQSTLLLPRIKSRCLNCCVVKASTSKLPIRYVF